MRTGLILRRRQADKASNAINGGSRLAVSRHIVLAIALSLMSAASLSAQPQPPAPPPPSSQPEHPLAAQMRQLLAAGKIADALAASEAQLKASPKDAAVVALYIELRMSIVRQAVAAQKFAQAEALLKAVLAAQPGHASAGKMLKVIDTARAGLDKALADADELLRLERFEQAAALLAQCAGLTPDQPARWKPSWMMAVVGAGDDQYLMHNYEAALPFYAQALELGAGEGPGSENLLWRWAHCYTMNLARSADLPRTTEQWAGIIDEAKDRFNTARADQLGTFLLALGHHNTGSPAKAIPAYRQLLGGNAPAIAPNTPPQQEAVTLRTAATSYVDSLNRSHLLDRRSGAWAMVLPGDQISRKDGRIVVRAPNDLVARRVLEAVKYHAPRLAAYLGGGDADLNWPVDYTVIVQAKPDDKLNDLIVPSYTRIDSQKGTLVRQETVCMQSDALLIGATVPHELTHVLISRLAGYPPVPLAIDEGLAIHAETTARYLMFHRSLTNAGGASLTVAQLLAANRLPPLAQRTRFYAECYNLVAWLMTLGKPAKVIDLARLTATMPATDALLKTYNIADLPTAEKAYRTFLEDQGLVRTR
ncbi:MAG: hypothetical protein PHU85_05345 [Phycisphaerae bacterium]|nr:hypothetical protein [Phycisphaerae bacterium]